jgi:hypothetical protein
MRYRRPLILAFSAAAVASVALLAAGCGGGGSPGVAQVASTTRAGATATAQGGLLGFSRCMRSNGFPNFPDPQRFAEGNVKLTIHQLGAAGPLLEAALTACHHLLPGSDGGSQESAQQQRTQLADELSFARCMRGHGVSRFPDPTPQGELSVEMVQARGIDVHSPAVLRVVQTCLPASHGALTPARIRQALANAHG